LPIVYALILGWLFCRYHPLDRSVYPASFIAAGWAYRLLMGIVLWYVYSVFYTDRSTSDIFRFYDDARVMYSVLHNDPAAFFSMLTGIGGDPEELDVYYRQMNNWYKQYNYFLYNDARTLIRFNALIMLFSFGSYHVHTVFMAAFSYLGGLYMVRAFSPFLREWKAWLFPVVLMVPSVAFWSSGVLKEGIFMGAFGVFLYALFRIAERRAAWGTWLALTLAALLLLVIKVYLFLCLIPGLLYLLSGKAFKNGRPFLRFLIVQVVCIAVLVCIPELFPQWDIFYILYKKRIDFINEAMIWSAGSLVDVPELQPAAWSFFRQIPFALVMALFRPFIWESGSPLMLLSAIENIFLALFFLLPVIAFRRPSRQEATVMLFCLSFVLYLYLLIGTTTPILGSLVRYKIPGIPVLLIVLLLLTDREKLFRRLGLKKNKL